MEHPGAVLSEGGVRNIAAYVSEDDRNKLLKCFDLRFGIPVWSEKNGFIDDTHEKVEAVINDLAIS